MRIICVCLFFCVFYLELYAENSPLAYSLPTPKTITIHAAWERVLSNNEGIKSEEFGVQKAQKLSLASKLSFLPSVDLSGFYVHMSTPISMQLIQDKSALAQMSALPIPGLSGLLNTLGSPIALSKQDIVLGALNIIYPLYVGGARIYASKIASLAAKDAAEALRLKKLATFEELIRVYYGVVLNHEILEVLQKIQKGHYTHYQNAIKMHKAGQIAKIEVLGAQVAYDRAKNKTIQAENSLEIAQLALNTILTSPSNLTPSSQLIAHTDKPLLGVEFFVQETLSSYPILKTLENQSLSAKELKKLTISKFLPQVGLFGSYLMKGQDTILNQMIPNWYVGVGARLPLITPEGRIQKYQAAKLTELQLAAKKTQARQDMELLVKKTYKQVVAMAQEYASLDSSIALAKENLKLQEQAFKQGMATSTQVVDARNALLGVMMEQKTIGYAYITSLASLTALSGRLDLFFEYQH
ncbi:hypothetical protein BKH46_05305 [Helicobacter sp. 12S02634-8]|uniref:TolC family protein n=1 Tax=Helicobacter sp. 12S02634-8 TaxID=1476199 RepID=UPI000BA5D425|nr:TolC family protein [Helicobacter sp. 12S02634-8]PAF47128.1 hypothetical protein BKH46_05305 [Helicobacter sp. 12S02634-8]